MPFCDAEGWGPISSRRAMDFTLCFQNSVITVVPSAILLLGLAPRLHKVLSKGRLEDVSYTQVFVYKIIGVLVALVLQIVFLALMLRRDGYPESFILSSSMYIASIVASLALHYFEYFNMPNPSSMLLVYWLFTALIGIFPTRSLAQESGQGLADTLALLKLLFVVVALLVFGLENFTKPNHHLLKRPHTTRFIQANPSPEPYANFFARITFLWVLPLLNKGKKKTLRMDDIWNLHPKLLSYPLFLTTQAKIDADEALARQQAKDLQSAGKLEEAEAVQLHTINLFSAILETVGWSYLSAAIPRLCYIPTLYVRPILFSSLITFMSSYSERSKAAGVTPQPVWLGFGYAIAVLTTSVMSNLFDAQFNNICFVASVRARGAIVGLIYRKSLRLSSTNKQEGIGAIVNHMSTDVDRIIAVFTVLHYLWGGVIELIIVAVLLYREIKYAMFASLGVVVGLVIIGGSIAPMVSRFEKKMMKEADQRMKLINEVVGHIKSVKLYVWERYFVKNITESRRRQLHYLRKFYISITAIATIFNMVNAFAVFAALTTYTSLASPENPLDIRRIFTTITLVNMLENPLVQLSSAIPTLITAKVAHSRLQKFLSSEEINPNNLERNLDPDASDLAYQIKDGTFGWYTPEAIQDITERREKEAKEKSENDAKEKEKQEKKRLIQKNTSGGADKGEAAEEKEKEDKKKTPDQEGSTISNESLSVAAAAAADNTTINTLGPVLHDVSLTIKRGSLSAIVGRVGEGKSSLVGALLGEMHKYNGTVRSYGRLAYVAQSAWILSDTVRNNILFGREYDKDRYSQVIHACALDRDFKMLVAGDKTLVGEKGINLSGGQKQRIAIARAVYMDADVYILDDPLSAVDAHVDQHIFQEVIKKLLASKTRILVTNGVHHLSDVDQIVVIKQGRVSQDGHYEELVNDTNGDLFRLVEESNLTHGVCENDAGSVDESLVEEISIRTGMGEEQNRDKEADGLNDAEEPPVPVKRPSYHRQKSSKWEEETKKDDLDLTDHEHIDNEVTIEGRVGWNVYKYYLKAVGVQACVFFVIALVVCLVIEFNTQLWLKNWGEDNEKPVPSRRTTYWVVTYLAWMLSTMVTLSFSIGITMVVMARRASKNLHASMLTPMVRSPMSFFDTTSSGKIVNRFSHDVSSVDVELPANFMAFLFILMAVIMQFAFAIAATVYFLILLAALLVCYYFLAGYFLVSSRELKRLDSAARSPMYAHFGETLNGLMTLRSFGEAERFATQATKLLDQSQQIYYLTNSTQRWLQIMLAFMSDIILGFIAVMAVVQRNTASAGVFGIVLSQIGTLTGLIGALMMEYCQIETNIVSVERIREYSQLPSEARDVIPDSGLDDQWPQQGKIEFKEYATRYRTGLDLVLHNISFTVQPAERIGIVGRTGAGKSSITLALFRIIEAAHGAILIDGVDISTLGLNDLRSRLTIIPQDPFLFGGTIRRNLDPFDDWQDADLWSALEQASLKSYVSSLPEGLHSVIENGGESMSLGQRQLMSLARAMLHKQTRILCLDEATAAIDIETDNAIQRALRKSFQGCTVLTIAHRINTIMDSDRILVLDHGRIAEFDTPQKLLNDPSTIFYSLVKTSEAARLTIRS